MGESIRISYVGGLGLEVARAGGSQRGSCTRRRVARGMPRDVGLGLPRASNAGRTREEEGGGQGEAEGEAEGGFGCPPIEHGESGAAIGGKWRGVRRGG